MALLEFEGSEKTEANTERHSQHLFHQIEKSKIQNLVCDKSMYPDVAKIAKLEQRNEKVWIGKTYQLVCAVFFALRSQFNQPMRVNFYDKYLKEQQANKTTINTAVASVFVQKG